MVEKNTATVFCVMKNSIRELQPENFCKNQNEDGRSLQVSTYNIRSEQQIHDVPKISIPPLQL